MFTNNSFSKVLDTKKTIQWKLGIAHEGQDVEWVELFKVDKPPSILNRVFGVDKSGNWVTEWQGKIISISYNKLAFVALLELDRDVLVSTIKKGLVNNDLPEIAVITFPIDDLLIFGLEDYGTWRRYCEKWIDNGYPLSLTIANACPENRKVKRWVEMRSKELFYIFD